MKTTAAAAATAAASSNAARAAGALVGKHTRGASCALRESSACVKTDSGRTVLARIVCSGISYLCVASARAN